MTDKKKTVTAFAKLLIDEGYLNEVPVQYRTVALRFVLKLRAESDKVFTALEDLVAKWAQAKEIAAESEPIMEVATEGKSDD